MNFNEFTTAFIAHDAWYSTMVTRRGSNYIPRVRRPEDVFQPTTVNEFINMLRMHIKVENAGEALRQQLNSKPGFNPFEAFNSLDIEQKGIITADDIRRILEARGYFVGKREADQVINRYDKQRKGHVTFAEFHDETRNKSPVRRF